MVSGVKRKPMIRITLTHTKTGKVTYAIVRNLPHDDKPIVGRKGAKFGWPNTVITACEVVR